MFNRFKIATRLTLGFGVLLLLLCGMAAMAWWQMSRLAANTNYYVVNIVPSSEVQHRIALSISDVRRAELRHVMTATDTGKDEVEAEVVKVRKSIAADLDIYQKELVSDPEDRGDMDRVGAALETYYADWDKVRAVSRKALTDAASADVAPKLLLGDSKRDYDAVHAAVQTWWDYNVKLSRQQEQDSRATYASARTVLSCLVAVALAIGIGAAVAIARSIILPIRRAVEVASTVAEGDLSSHIVAHGKDETAQLLQALGRMNVSLARIVGQVRHSSDSIATGSTQIASGNEDLSQRTEEQASNLQQTAASMEQLSSTVKTNADTAEQANRLAAEASAAATLGGEKMGAVVTTMQEIAVSSKRIADIIGVIDGIAFQTNILALNAAVEAARAGEQGRGFAVVAGEVRVLAGRSAEAAKEIKTLIGASAEKVDVGARQVGEAGSSMDAIVTQVRRVSQLIGQISNATSEQSMGISQVGDAVMQLDQVTQQNAALVEQGAAAAESLRHQAGALAELVSRFKLGAAGLADGVFAAALPQAAPAAGASTVQPGWASTGAPAKHHAQPLRQPQRQPSKPAVRRGAAPTATGAHRLPATTARHGATPDAEAHATAVPDNWETF